MSNKNDMIKAMWGKFFLLFGCCLLVINVTAQNIPIDNEKFLIFPHPLTASTRVGVGFNGTVIPNEISEEVHYRIPAGELRLMKKISNHLDLDARLLVQVLQNMIIAGPRWSTELSDRVSMGLGNNLGFWFGRINLSGVNTSGRGFQNYPNIAFGYRFNKRILASVKAESIMNFGIYTKAGNIEVKSDYRLFSGSAYTIALEQPFAGNKSVTLAFKAIYTDYFWQTWTLFENYDRNLFFPQITVLLVL